MLLRTIPDADTSVSDDRLRELVGRLLVRDADAHADAIDEPAEVGDDRVVPHLLETLVIDAIGNDWERFGFPAVLRERDPPRYLDLPEVRWPGAADDVAFPCPNGGSRGSHVPRVAVRILP